MSGASNKHLDSNSNRRLRDRYELAVGAHDISDAAGLQSLCVYVVCMCTQQIKFEIRNVVARSCVAGLNIEQSSLVCCTRYARIVCTSDARVVLCLERQERFVPIRNRLDGASQYR